jgi:hypothetical protein
MIPVTKTWLPDIRKYQRYVEKIYAGGWVMDDDLLVKEFEVCLADDVQG